MIYPQLLTAENGFEDGVVVICPACGEIEGSHGYVYDDADCPHKCHGVGYLVRRVTAKGSGE